MSRLEKTNQANQLRIYRKKRGIRLRGVAKMIGQSSSAHISHWERGNKLPSLTNALKLSAAIQCPVEVLFLDLFNQLRTDIYANKRKHNIKLIYK